MPYRTQDNVIDGVVVTFIDITAIKQLEAELRKEHPVATDSSQNSNDPELRRRAEARLQEAPAPPARMKST
jgi:hypothetical protein